MQQPYLNTTVFSSLLFHINILILTRVIREMTKMQLRGGKQIQQIRYELLSKLRLKESLCRILDQNIIKFLHLTFGNIDTFFNFLMIFP